MPMAATLDGEHATRPVSSAEPNTERGPLARVNKVGSAGSPKPSVPATGLATITVIAGYACLVASLIVLGYVAEGVRQQEVFALDTWATPFLHGIASPGMDALMTAVTTLGSSLFIAPLYLASMAWLILRRRYGGALFVTVASGGSLLIQETMKLWFRRPRPTLEWAAAPPDFSFPSGHTMNAVLFYVSIALIMWSVLGQHRGLLALAVSIAVAVGVGISRIYLGAHYLTDVVGGLLAGFSWLLVVGAAFNARPAWWRWGQAAPDPAPRAGGRRSAKARDHRSDG
jgi:membrane-associated phospholipid phosphatase